MAAAQEWLTPADFVNPDSQWWSVCPVDDLEVLGALLAAARTQCEALAPVIADGEAVPDAYRLAQAMQARALWRAQRAGSGDAIGADGLSVTVFPMDWTVKALLRPRGRLFTR